MSRKYLVYTGLLGDGDVGENPIIWITIEGKAFLGCPHKCIEPFEHSEPDILTCPRCKWKTTTQFAREVLADAIGHLLALYAMIDHWDPVESVRTILEGRAKETDKS